MPVETVVHRFAAAAKFFPRRAALYAGDRRYTYRELSALAQGIRNGLIESGFAGSPRIGLLSGRDACSYASVLAILGNGSAYVPLDHRRPRELNARIIEDAGIEVTLVSDAQEAAGWIESSLPADVEVMRTRASDSDSRQSAGLDVSAIADDALACIMYRFDDARRPIGVPIYHRNLSSFLDAFLDPRCCGYTRDDRFLQSFDLSADRSVAALFAPLCIGACCYVAPDDETPAQALIAELAITVALMVPPAEAALTAELPSLRHSLFFGPGVPPLFIERWSERAPNTKIHTVYGCAETTVYCLSREWKAGDAQDAFSIGMPLPRMEAFIIDGEDRLTPAGQPGELCLRGAQVGGHYWNHPSYAVSAFVDLAGSAASAYRTGDLCSTDGRGAFVFHGSAGRRAGSDAARGF